MTPTELCRAYESGDISGWLGKDNPELVREQFRLISHHFQPFRIVGQAAPTAGRKVMLYQAVRAVLGKDTDNYPQQVGDCVAFGAKNATEYLTCLDILMRGKRVKWRPVFPSFYYGTGRVYIGNSRISGDGSLGSWMAAAVQKYGTLFSDEKDVPKYSGSVSRAWGDANPRNDLDNWKQTASPYLVKSAAVIKSWDELVAAICNGYPCTTASNVGYNMEPSSDGFHRQTTSWPHQMCIISVDDNDKDPYALILNSWGTGAHGKLKDFDDGHDLPGGVLRVRRKDIEKHIRAEEMFAFSNFNGFPAQDIDKALFKIF